MPLFQYTNRHADLTTTPGWQPHDSWDNHYSRDGFEDRDTELEQYLASLLIENRGSGAPTGVGAAGQQYFDTTGKRLYLSDGVGWVIMAEALQTNTSMIFAGFTEASATAANSYHRSDGWIDVVSTLTLGNTPSAVSGFTWAPPQVAAALPVHGLNVAMHDFSAGQWYPATINEGTSSVGLFTDNSAGTNVVIGASSLTLPFVWAVSDRIIISGRYRMTTRYS